MDNGLAEVRTRVSSIARGLRARGAEVDGVVVDNETTLHASHFVQNPGSYAAIQADPRWPALADSLGLPRRFADPTWGSSLYFDWTSKLAGRFDQALNSAVYMPMREVFPSVQCSNYCSGPITPTAAWPDVHGHLDKRTTAGFGTHDSEEFYGWTTPARAQRTAGSAETSDPWRAFRVEIAKARGMAASSPRPKHAWIGASSWSGESWAKVSLYGSGLWEEMLLQIGMHGIETFLVYSPYLPSASAEETRSRISLVDGDQDRVQLAIAELNQTAGACSSVRTDSPRVDWNSSAVMTGRVIGNETLWRISVSEKNSIAEITFDDGRRIEVQSDAGRYGTWVKLPKAMRPVSVRSSERSSAIDLGTSAAGAASPESSNQSPSRLDRAAR